MTTGWTHLGASVMKIEAVEAHIYTIVLIFHSPGHGCDLLPVTSC